MFSKLECIQAIKDKLGDRCSSFELDALVHLLQSTSRQFGYPNYHDGIDPRFHYQRARDSICSMREIKNFQQYHIWMGKLYSLWACISYFYETLWYEAADEELYALLQQAIALRIDTTDEDKCGEQSLLAAMVFQPLSLMSLLSEYLCQIQAGNLMNIFEHYYSDYSHRTIKKFREENGLPEEAPVPFKRLPELSDKQNQLYHRGMVIAEALQPFCLKSRLKDALEKLAYHYHLAIVTAVKKESSGLGIDVDAECHVSPESLWLKGLNLSDLKLLKTESSQAALTSLQQEWLRKHRLATTRTELQQYMGLINQEVDFFAFFKRARQQKTTKRLAAEKYLQLLEGQTDVRFTRKEQEALTLDHGNRLTGIYTFSEKLKTFSFGRTLAEQVKVVSDEECQENKRLKGMK